MEIGDLFVVNKADREGADRTVLEIEMMLEHGESDDGWRPKIFKTVASRGEGIEAFASWARNTKPFTPLADFAW
jgi:LAO/AO transport system kinase